jgi:acyl carrier protein
VNIIERVRNAIRHATGNTYYEFSWNDYLSSDVGIDSLSFYELVMALEEAFDIEIPDADSLKIETTGDIIEYLATRGFNTEEVKRDLFDIAAKICSYLRIKWEVPVTSSEDREAVVKIMNENGIK